LKVADRFPGITGNAKAPARAQTIAGVERTTGSASNIRLTGTASGSGR
jgi:hypothetical protein